MPPMMPAGAMVEGLKQGNAVELELVKTMEEGFKFITDGLMRECYNRSDALSELRKSLPTTEATVNATQIADIKTIIEELSREGIFEVDKIKAEARTACGLAQHDSDEVYQDDIVRHQKARDRNKAGARRLKNTANILNELRRQSNPESNTLRPMWARLVDEYEASLAAYDEDVSALKEELKQIEARADKRKQRARESYGRVLSDARKNRELWERLLDCADELEWLRRQQTATRATKQNDTR